MTTKAYPDIYMSETYNQTMINHLLQGLSNQSIAYEVLIGQPRTLFQAVDMITNMSVVRRTAGRKHLSTYHNSD